MTNKITSNTGSFESASSSSQSSAETPKDEGKAFEEALRKAAEDKTTGNADKKAPLSPPEKSEEQQHPGPAARPV